MKKGFISIAIRITSLFGMEIKGIRQNSLQIYLKLEREWSHDLAILPLGTYPNYMNPLYQWSHRVDSSSVHTIQDMKPIKVPIIKWMDKDVEHIYKLILLMYKKE